MEIPENYIWYLLSKTAINIPYKYWDACCYDYDDLYQEAAIVFLDAFKKYDPQKGTLESWFRLRLSSKISKIRRDAITKIRGGVKENPINYIRLDNKKNYNKFSSGLFEERVIDKIYSEELVGKMKMLLGELNDREYEVLKQWFKGLSQLQSGELLGINQTAVGKIRRRIEKKAKQIS